jgi:cytochrome c-type protein NapC
MNLNITAVACAALGVSLASFALPAWAVDWTKVPSHPITLIYPAQTSFEWSLTKKDHSAAPKFKQGKTCKDCHINEEEKYGVPLAEGKRWEPNPIPGKRGAVPLQVQFAHDGKNIHMRVEWEQAKFSGGKKMEPDFSDKLALVLGDNSKEATFARAGCWAVCHDDQTGMASAGDDEREKYLAQSRTQIKRSGGGDNLRSQAALDKLLDNGVYLEYWQAHLKDGGLAEVVDGYILEKRHINDKPAVSATAELKDGKWRVVMSRPLTGAGAHHIDLEAGQTYTVGLALHEVHTNGRYHQVSWEYSLALDGGEADIVVSKH